MTILYTIYYSYLMLKFEKYSILTQLASISHMHPPNKCPLDRGLINISISLTKI